MLEICRNCLAFNGGFLAPFAACKKDTQYHKWNDSCDDYRVHPKMLHSSKKQNAYVQEE